MADESNDAGQDDGVQAGAVNKPLTIDDIPQELQNQIAKKNRVGLQSKLREAQQRAGAFDQLQAEVQELIDSGLIDGVEDLSGFRERAGEVLDSYRSETEKAQREIAAQAKKLEQATKQAELATNKFKTSTIERGLKDAAPPGSKTVSQGATNLVAKLLAEYSDLDENDNVVVTMPDVKDDETGQVGPKVMTPAEAVAHLESQVNDYGTLFVSTVNSGAGGEVIDGVKRTQDGGIDLGNLASSEAGFEKFLEIMDKNPDALLRAMGEN